MENYQWLLAVIENNPNRRIVGRTRLQKTIRLLQRAGLPSEYQFSMYFYGPYSDAVKADLRLLSNLGVIREDQGVGQDGPYFVISVIADIEIALPELDFDLGETLGTLDRYSSVVLELAATYDSFREQGASRQEAMKQLRRKKGEKCTEENVAEAMELLRMLGLST